MKFFVTGASGMLGTTLYKYYVEKGHEVISTDLNPLDPWTTKLDIRDKEALFKRISEEKPDWVLNLAALTDVEYCELHPEDAYATNALGPKNIAEICAELNIPMVHISTAGVFDGTRDRPYTEEDIPNPINEYGKAKYAGDLFVSSILKKYFIFRAGWMMGSGDRDKKFIKKMLNQYDAGKRQLFALTDVYGCPTSTLDFARNILKVITSTDKYGLYHMVSNGSCTRYDVAKVLFEALELYDVELVEVTGEYFKESFFAPRPDFEVIENKRLNELNLNFMLDWKDALIEYLSIYFKEKYADKSVTYVAKSTEKSTVVYDKNLPLVSLVTTAYNNVNFNEKYFESVKRQTYKNIEVVFVDNMSTDNTFEDASSKLINGRVILSSTNKGCASGNNLGVLSAKGDYIFLLGPDTWMEDTCVEELVKVAMEKSNVILAPKQRIYDGDKLINCGVAIDIFGYPARTYTVKGDVQVRTIFYADGSGVFMKRSDYLKVGLMDDRTFLFAEDVELSWKARMLGLEIVPVGKAALHHFSGGSVGIGGAPKDELYTTKLNRRVMAERNMLSNMLKNYSLFTLLFILPAHFILNLFEILMLSLSGQWKIAILTHYRSYLWNIQNIRATLFKRRFIQGIRTVSDLKVMEKMYLFPSKLLAFMEIGFPKIND